MSDSATLAIAIIGAVTGFIGTVTGTVATILSVLQYRRDLDRERVKLHANVSWGMAMADPESPFLVVSVTNLSTFDVTISEAGLFTNGGMSRTLHPHTMAGVGRLPQLLQPRERLSINFPLDFLSDPQQKTATCAYVATQCGTVVEIGHKEIPAMVAEAQAG